MKFAVSLAGVLVIAHVLMLAGHSVPMSPWTPVAYFWQDLTAAMLFGAVIHVLKPSWLAWTSYAALVIYVAINVPVARVLSSPLTWAMMRAARGPLRDSITFYLSFQNIGLILLVIVTGLVLPLALRRLTFPIRFPLVIAAAATLILGPLATAQVETSGFHRNAFGALFPVRLASGSFVDDRGWRTPPSGSPSSNESLAAYRGRAAGRNVILIALESTAAQYLGLYGANPDPMPNLSKLAAQSIVFERAYTVYPESIKGLLSVLCSRYPAFQTAAERYARLRCASIAQLLADAGYRTALFHSGRFMYLGMDAIITDRGFDLLEDAGAIGGNVNSSFGVDEPAVVNRMLAWIDSLPSNQPFFVTYLPVAGHHPYAVPEAGPFPAETDFGNYLNALHYGDKSLGDLVRGLQERGLEEKTLFVIFGDHGEAFGQHDGNLGHSLFVYEENVRIPYLIAAPGMIRQIVKAPTTASVIDTAPTILDLLGMVIPLDYQGTSLLHDENRMALFFTDYSLGFLGLSDSCWKFIFEMDSRRSKLFDVCRDPEEKRDLSSKELPRVNAYQANLERWIAAQEAPR